MDCYKIARRIMDRIRQSSGYGRDTNLTYHSVTYYDSPRSHEFFCLNYKGVDVYISCGRMLKVEIRHPRGIVLFNIRLWLLEIDRMTK